MFADKSTDPHSGWSRLSKETRRLPLVIQGGLGVAVSNWRLARTVSALGQLGVVSGTAIDQVMVRRLQDGDRNGALASAFKHFPIPEAAARIWKKYFIKGGKQPARPYDLAPAQSADASQEFLETCILANFAEVWLARQRHRNPVGINFMEKVQPPHLASIYGAMLAGVSYVLMGAGIPMKIPAVLDQFANHEAASYPLHITGRASGNDQMMCFDPKALFDVPLPMLTRPHFLAIVSSSVLAATLAKKANGQVDGFVVEGPTAGGHNAPPRGQLQLNASGEPVYGERDHVDPAKIRAVGLPFWLAGGYGSAQGLRNALDSGAAGIQVGTAFAFCQESGMRNDYRDAVTRRVLSGTIRVLTDPLASPTGFPFKVVSLPGTISDKTVFDSRQRLCDLGYLREAYQCADGSVGFRCPSEPAGSYCAKGGQEPDTRGRKCICNALLSTIGQPQVRGAYVEPAVVTAGDDLAGIRRFFKPGAQSYSAADVLSQLLSDVETVR
jgi:nitronate monooxygenase